MRNIYFAGFSLLLLALHFPELMALAGLSWNNALYSHFLLIPLVSVYFLVRNRKAVFSEPSFSLQAGIPVVLVGFVLYLISKHQSQSLTQNDYLSLMMLALVTGFIGGFIAFYGQRAFRKAMFPLLFLAFIIPIPSIILEPLIKTLLIGSAESSYGVFKILGVPVYRDGFIFELPGIAIEVARQCSGIRSTLALSITGVLAGHLFLRTGWRKLVLVLAIFPITIFKNSLRIVTISLLAAYVDPIFLTNHWIHSAGGKPFFILALVFLLPVLWYLRRSERQSVSDDNEPPALQVTGSDH